MTIKEVVEEAQTVLNRMKEGGGTREEKVNYLHKLLGVLAVKAEMVSDFDTEELVAKIDLCRELLKQGAFANADKAIRFAELLSQIQCYKWEEDESDAFEKECAEADREYALEDIKKAYSDFLSLKDAYIKNYGEYPDIEI